MERFESSPVTRIFFPVSSGIGGLYWPHAAPPAYLADVPAFSRRLRGRVERSLCGFAERRQRPVLELRRAAEASRPRPVLYRGRSEIHAAGLRAATPVPLPQAAL